jgi:6-phosphofructokinase
VVECAYVQGLVNKLTDYGVPEGNVLGIRYGFRGFYDKVGATAVQKAAARVTWTDVHTVMAWPCCSAENAPSAWARGSDAAAAVPLLVLTASFAHVQENKPIPLTKHSVDGIQLQGGTILGTSRGGANMK